jgi:hypothetical protein
MSLAPELSMLAEEIANCAMLAIERGLAVRAGIEGVAAAERPDAFDRAADALIGDLGTAQVQRMTNRVRTSLGAASRAERRDRRGQLADMPLDTGVSISEHIDRLPLETRFARNSRFGVAASTPAEMRPAQRLMKAVRDLFGLEPLPPPPPDRLGIEAPIAGGGSRTVAIDTTSLAILMNPLPAAGSSGAPASTSFAGVGSIETAYQKCGGPNGPLGEKLGEPMFDRDPQGRGYMVLYTTGGAVFWVGKPEAFCMWGPIFAKWQAIGGSDVDYLGVPATDVTPTPDGVGRFVHFFGGGSIYWGPKFGAHEVHGAIKAKWASMGYEKSIYGYPKTDELPGREPPPHGPIGAFSRFDRGTIYWSPRHGAFPLPDVIDQIYQEMHAELGCFGYPLWSGNETSVLTPVNFEGGRVTVVDGKPELRELKTDLSLMVNFVKAVKKTKGISKDEISLGIVKIDSLGRHTHERFNLGQFGNGDVWLQRIFNNFKININDEPHPWPRNYVWILALAEINGNGFDSFLLSMISVLNDEVGKVLGKAGKVAGGAVAVANPVLGFVVQTILAVILPKVLGMLWDHLKGILEEDTIFEPIVETFHLPSLQHYGTPIGAFDGWLWLSDETRTRKAGGGEYEMNILRLIG